MLRKLHRLAELAAPEWLILFQLVPIALASRVALRFTTLPRLTNFIARSAGNPRLKHLPLFHRKYDPERLYVLANLAARVTFGSGLCLGRSLLLLWMLKARDQPAELLVGVNKGNDVFHAHAWVETQGRVIGDRPEITDQFAVLLRI